MRERLNETSLEVQVKFCEFDESGTPISERGRSLALSRLTVDDDGSIVDSFVPDVIC